MSLNNVIGASNAWNATPPADRIEAVRWVRQDFLDNQARHTSATFQGYALGRFTTTGEYDLKAQAALHLSLDPHFTIPTGGHA